MMQLAKEKSKTDAEFYKIQKQTEANRLLLNKEFLELKRIGNANFPFSFSTLSACPLKIMFANAS
jgi:hypothetical protein